MGINETNSGVVGGSQGGPLTDLTVQGQNASFVEFSEELADKGFVTAQLDKVVNWA